MEQDHRISRHQMFMDMCEVIAKRSTCFRGNVGALVVLDNDPVAMGYNGPPSGEEHCKGNQCELVNRGCSRSVHAERNALRRLSGKISAGSGKIYDIYCTAGPCLECANLMVAYERYIKRIFYRNPYRTPEGLDLIVKRFDVYRITPSGFIVDQLTNKIVILK